MKKPILVLLLFMIIAISCGKQKEKKAQENKEVLELEEQIKEDQNQIDEFNEVEKELDALSDELESILESDE